MSGGSWEREGWGLASLACPVILERQKEVDSYIRLVIMTGKKACAGQYYAIFASPTPGFLQLSGTHKPCQRATTSLKPGVSNVNIA